MGSEAWNVQEWIGLGSVEEDAGNVFTAHYYNHFHNPLRAWPLAGLNTIYPFINGQSSLLWAQDSSNPWSWRKTREHFYSALVSSTDAGRSESFARTFKGVGHIIHLIQDAAQPAHVRNDPHPLDDMGVVPQFENWARSPAHASTVASLMATPAFPSVYLGASADPGYVPITQLWDADQYNGANPPGGTGTGISEYTQVNFFSEDTIGWGGFPYPVISGATPVVTRGFSNPLSGTTYPREYYLKDCCGETNGGQGYLLAAVDYLDFYRLKYPLFGGLLPKIPVLDNNVYGDYARFLIPRAVGYSAALIDYFFRIEMEISEIAPKKDADGNITEVTLRVKNGTQTGEALSGGRFRLNVRYKLPGSAENNYRLSDEVLSGDVPAGNDPKDDAFKFTFSFPDYIPKDAANLQYTLAYRGPTKNLAGQVTEPDAVAGRVYNPGRRVFVAANNSPKDMLLWGLARSKSSANLVRHIPVSHQNFYRGLMQGTFEVYAWDEHGNAVSDLDLVVVTNPLGQDTGTLKVAGEVNLDQQGHATIQVTPGNEVLGLEYLRATFRVESADGKIQSNVAELFYTEPATITATIDAIEACYRVGEGWSGDPYDCPGISGDWSSETKTWQESVVSPIQGKSVPPVFTDGAINTLYFFDTHDPETKAVFQDGTVIPLSGLGIDERGFVEYVDNKNAVSDEYKVTITAEIKEALVLGTEAINLHSVEGVYLGANAPKTGFDYFAGGHFFGGTIILGTPPPSDGSKVTVYFRTNLETERIQYVQ